MNSITKKAAESTFDLLRDRLEQLDDPVAAQAFGLLTSIDNEIVEHHNNIIDQLRACAAQLQEERTSVNQLQIELHNVRVDLEASRDNNAVLAQMNGGAGSLTKMLGEFHEMGNIYSDQTSAKQFMKNRIDHLQEELDEIKRGLEENDAEEVLDGLIDLTYLAIGAADILNLPMLAGFRVVHDANMKKECCVAASESPRGKLPDYFKPPGWESPDLKKVLLDAGLGLEFTQGDEDTIASRHALSNS